MLLNSQTRTITVSFVVFALLGLGFAAFNVHQVGQLIVGLVVCAVMVIAAAQTAKSSIRWDRQGVVGRWTGATRRVGWSEIAGFEHREGFGLGAQLQNGRWLRLMPYPRSRLNKPEQAIAALEAGRRAAGRQSEQGTPAVP